MIPDLTEQVMERFWSKVEVTGFCWLWVGTIGTSGYGAISVRRHMRPAHRIAYQVLVGPIPEGLVTDHLCRVRRCVNPDHLELVTPAENHRRGVYHLRDACVNGHPLSGVNLYRYPDGRRLCRTCNRAAQRRSRGQVAAG